MVVSGEVGSGAGLVLLSQGSTKVFKFRPGRRAASLSGPIPVTRQELHFSVQSGAALLLLPDPVTCFEAASYTVADTGGVRGALPVDLAIRGAPPPPEQILLGLVTVLDALERRRSPGG